MESIPQAKTPVIVVDDEPSALLSMKTAIVSAGMPEPALVSDPLRVMDLLRRHDFHLALLDLKMPKIDGMELLKQIKQERPEIECVIVTAMDDVSIAVKAIQYGAYDYLLKPLKVDKLLIVINRALERYNLRHGLALYGRDPSFAELKNPTAFKDIISEEKSMARVFHQVEAVAPTDYSVILTGESGTGKEMLARIIHLLSRRKNRPFVAVNMAAFSRHLFDADFFGHTRGAYTGAVKERKGFFEAAQGGTLFLDEVAELEYELQAKLLRVLQDKEIYRLGSTESKNVDIRIIAASNRDIQKEMEAGRFRSDLFFRLNMYHIKLPPLRERRKDVLPLAYHFLRHHAADNNKKVTGLSPELEELFNAYSFPGNVRELENIIASAVLLEKGELLSIVSAQDFLPLAKEPPIAENRLEALADVEKRHIRQVLQAMGGNRTRAAEVLGIGLRTLQRKLKEYDEI